MSHARGSEIWRLETRDDFRDIRSFKGPMIKVAILLICAEFENMF